jgi:sulfonate transport system permease protein
MRMPLRERIHKVILPSLTPHVLTGVRISVAIGLVSTIFLEVLGVQRGLGHLLLESQQRFNADAVWGLMFIAGIGGYLINLAVSGIERYFLRHWPPRR